MINMFSEHSLSDILERYDKLMVKVHFALFALVLIMYAILKFLLYTPYSSLAHYNNFVFSISCSLFQNI